jgi:hypothetical protein
MMGADAIRCTIRIEQGGIVGDDIPWDDADKAGSRIALSDEGFVATKTQSLIGGGGADTSSAKSAGALYGEFICIQATNAYVGIAKTGYSRYAFLGQNADSYGYRNNGDRYFDTSYTSGYPAWTVGDSVGVGVDFDNNTLEFFKNGQSLGVISATLDGGSYTLAWVSAAVGDSIRLTTNPANMAYPMPSGYSAWSLN